MLGCEGDVLTVGAADGVVADAGVADGGEELSIGETDGSVTTAADIPASVSFSLAFRVGILCLDAAFVLGFAVSFPGTGTLVASFFFVDLPTVFFVFVRRPEAFVVAAASGIFFFVLPDVFRDFFFIVFIFDRIPAAAGEDSDSMSLLSSASPHANCSCPGRTLGRSTSSSTDQTCETVAKQKNSAA
ncbi:MAG: hypothetical protein R3C59_07935 [Planctomycetaceae bacterium]